jgi:hypothetical protein
MEMTIDDNVDFLNEAKKLFEDIANNPSINETVKTYLIIESLESAIDTMRKYQKIERILKEPCIIPEGCYPILNKIREVIKDENN